MKLLKDQQRVAKEHFTDRIFLEGAAGTGKTTAAIERIKNLVNSGVPLSSILVIVPQSALALPYREGIRRAKLPSGGQLQTYTIGSLAYKMVDLFWLLIAEEAGFENPQERPLMLSLELVQYYMTRFVEPEIARRDYFNSVHISRSRLYTQIVDNLNKAALIGFDYQTIGERLKSAWRGAVEQRYIYDDAQASANLFRDVCRKYNMLDFSLQVTLFVDFLWGKAPVKQYLTQQYRHLIVDNLEEDTPATHDLIKDWLKSSECESALLIYDQEAGYRSFLGADVVNAYALKKQCKVKINLDKPRIMSPAVEALQVEMGRALHAPDYETLPKSKIDPREALVYQNHRYQPQMMDWTVEQVVDLVNNQGVHPAQIVILAPYLPDALRFSLQTRLDQHDIPNRSHRPSRALREEPTTRTLLTLAKLAHPQWEIPASKFDVAYALSASIAELDLVRSRLLVDVLYRQNKLLPFDTIREEGVQSRITYDLGLRYEDLRQWLESYQAEVPIDLDFFFQKLFGELLSKRSFGFANRLDAANTVEMLIQSAREFRQTVTQIEPDLPVAPEYVRMVANGVLANQYTHQWDEKKQDAVLIAPAHTFLMSNQAVDYQFWLNVGSSGWAQRLYQPLTHPQVMSRQWPQGRIWSDQDDEDSNQALLWQLVLGLIRRTRKKIYLGMSEFSEQGFEQRGHLLMGIHRLLRTLSQERGDNV